MKKIFSGLVCSIAFGMRRHWVVTAIAVVLIPIVALLSWSADRVYFGDKYAARAAQRTADRFDTAPLAEPISVAHAAEALIAAEAARRGEAVDADSPWQDALRTALDWLAVWSAGDPDRYIEWMNEHGSDVPDGFPIWHIWDMDRYAKFYQLVVGRPMPESITIDDYFRQYYKAYFARMKGALRPESVAIDPKAVIVNTLEYTHWSDYFDTDLDAQPDGLGDAFWVGSVIYSGMTLLWPQRMISTLKTVEGEPPQWHLGSFNDLSEEYFGAPIDEFGSVLAAEIRFVYRGATGVNVPTTVWLRRVPDRQHSQQQVWQITGLSISNVDSDMGVTSDHPYLPPF